MIGGFWLGVIVGLLGLPAALGFYAMVRLGEKRLQWRFVRYAEPGLVSWGVAASTDRQKLDRVIIGLDVGSSRSAIASDAPASSAAVARRDESASRLEERREEKPAKGHEFQEVE